MCLPRVHLAPCVEQRGGHDFRGGAELDCALRHALRGGAELDCALGHALRGGAVTGLTATIVVIAVAMVFNYTNGFHDAANAIATSVSTRALTPRFALLMAAVGNLVGSFFGVKVAATVGKGVITAP